MKPLFFYQHFLYGISALFAAYTPPFPFGTASGHIMQEGDNPPAYAGKKSGLFYGLCGAFF